MILRTQRPRKGETQVSASPKPQDPENTAENGTRWSKARYFFFVLISLMGLQQYAMPMPKKRRCQCDTKIEECADECSKCARMCVCGRKLAYSGRGRPRGRCERCAELRPDYRACGICGAMVPRSRRRWCSAACAREARRVQRGGLPGDAWQQNMVSVLEQQDAHEQAARYLAAWLRYVKNMNVWAKGASIVFSDSALRFETRHTSLRFTSVEDLPEWVVVDDRLRLESLRSLRPPVTGTLAGYALASKGFDTVAVTRAGENDVLRWRERRCWIPRLCDHDYELSCRAESFEVHALLRPTKS